MVTLDSFAQESESILEDAKYAPFRQVGSWCVLLQFVPRWHDDRSFQNMLVDICNASRVFELAGGETPQAENYKYEGDKREVYRSDESSPDKRYAKFWRVSINGLAYYRRTYNRGALNSEMPFAIDRRKVVREVKLTLDFAKLASDNPAEIRVRWDHLAGRELVDATATKNLDTFDSMPCSKAAVSVGSALTPSDAEGDGAIGLVCKLTAPLFKAFDHEPTRQQIEQWLADK